MPHLVHEYAMMYHPAHEDVMISQWLVYENVIMYQLVHESAKMN